MEFYKYQGTGNDFVMVDNRNLQFPKDKILIEKCCDRRFGIGGDGLILLENHPTLDFKMVYYNSDGRESTMCGNGGRCIIAFANFLEIFKSKTKFEAIDGLHEGEIKNSLVRLKMSDVSEIKNTDDDFELNTGSPHYIQLVENVENFDVYKNGSAIRNSERYLLEGINENFVQKIADDQIFVRTFERGVEDETFSCGTGVTAAALVHFNKENSNSVNVKTLGGNLKLSAEKKGNSFQNIWLEGPAVKVFKGKIKL